MPHDTLSRRSLLKELAGLPAAGSLLMLSACSKTASVLCADPNKLSAGDASLRASLHYTEESPDAQKTCSACGFFVQATPAGCGECQMLKGPVNAGGRCDSWSSKG
jgi:hypothetical protein